MNWKNIPKKIRLSLKLSLKFLEIEYITKTDMDSICKCMMCTGLGGKKAVAFR
jgi:hypothetical protein